jgi:glycosyltransferase involved in cell wall biosynthesis
MKVMFIDGTTLEYGPEHLSGHPLGGSQSALLMVAEGLARSGVEVLAAGRHFPEGRAAAGFSCVRLGEQSFGQFHDVDVVVTLNRLMTRELLTRAFRPGCRYLHWHQNDSRSPYGRTFMSRASWEHVNGFVLVSHFQANDFVSRFGLPSAQVTVIGNPVPHQFLSLFDSGTSILGGKDPDLMIYASAPNRGLDGLLHIVLPALRRRRPSVRLEVYSGFYLDQGLRYAGVESQDQTAAMEALLAEGARMPGVRVGRGLRKDELALRFREAAVLCYPCTFRETFCNTVREAMAAACIVSTTDAGVLPETTAGFGVLTRTHVGAEQQVQFDGAAFASATLAALEARNKTPEVVEQRLRQQIEYVRRNSALEVVTAQWLRLLRDVS